MVRSQDYHAHISKLHSAPSILTDVPRYPNAHLAFNKKVVYNEDKGFITAHKPMIYRVEVVDYEHTTVPDNGVEVLYEENVDLETHQYYPKKKFELQKWKTFRP